MRCGGRFDLKYYPPGHRQARRALFRNAVTDEGLDYLLAAGFLSKIRYTFYVGLIAGNGFTELRHNDSARGHPGWAEFISYFTADGSGYQFGKRSWETTAPQGGRLDSRFDAKFVIRSAGTIRGAFLTSLQTATFGTNAILFCAGDAGADVDVEPNGVVVVTYHLTLADEA